MAKTTLRKEFEEAFRQHEEPNPLDKIIYSTNDAILNTEFDGSSESDSCEFSWIHAWGKDCVYVTEAGSGGIYVKFYMRDPTPANVAEHQGMTRDQLILQSDRARLHPPMSSMNPGGRKNNY